VAIIDVGGWDDLGDLADPLAGVQRHRLDVARTRWGASGQPTEYASVSTVASAPAASKAAT
jgi:hypothetical protein